MYRQNGNNPGRKEQDLSPEEVKQMITGNGEASFGGAEEANAYQTPNRPLWEDIDGVRFVDFVSTDAIYAIDRCLTCGRAFNCACTDCKLCDANGRPLPEFLHEEID